MLLGSDHDTHITLWYKVTVQNIEICTSFSFSFSFFSRSVTSRTQLIIALWCTCMSSAGIQNETTVIIFTVNHITSLWLAAIAPGSIVFLNF